MIDYIDYIRYIGALLFVIALIMGLAVLLRRLGNSSLMGGMGVKRSDKRLRVLEVQPIDPRRRLVLVAQDDVEHLLMIGPERDLVISHDRPARPATTEVADTKGPQQGEADAKETGTNSAPAKARYVPGSRPADHE